MEVEFSPRSMIKQRLVFEAEACVFSLVTKALALHVGDLDSIPTRAVPNTLCDNGAVDPEEYGGEFRRVNVMDTFVRLP